MNKARNAIFKQSAFYGSMRFLGQIKYLTFFHLTHPWSFSTKNQIFKICISINSLINTPVHAFKLYTDASMCTFASVHVKLQIYI